MDSNHERELDDTDEVAFEMELYLNGALVHLNMDQMLQINTIARCKTPSQKIAKSTSRLDEDRIQHEYTLYTDDTFLHSIFGDTNATYIKQIIDHKLIAIILVLLLVMAYAFWFIVGECMEGRKFVNAYLITLYWLLWIPWFIFKHLLCNKVAFKLCIETFDFWIKVAYGFMFSIASLLYSQPPVDGITLTHIQQSSFLVFVVLSISFISSFDAVYGSKAKKLIVSVCMGCAFFVWFIRYEFLSNDKDDYKITIQLADGVKIISIQQFLASASRILALFLWKQSYKTWRSTERAVTITNAPKITWIDKGSKEENLADVINRNIAKETSTKTMPTMDIRPHMMRNTHHSNDSESSISVPIV